MPDNRVRDTRVGDMVRVEGREGWFRVWSTLSAEGRVMIEDMPGCAIGPCKVIEARHADA